MKNGSLLTLAAYMNQQISILADAGCAEEEFYKALEEVRELVTGKRMR